MGSEGNEAIAILPHEALVQKMARDLYFGNGKPALTVRMALQEEQMETVHSNISEIKKGQEKFNALLITTLISSVGGLLLMVFELIKHR